VWNDHLQFRQLWNLENLERVGCLQQELWHRIPESIAYAQQWLQRLPVRIPILHSHDRQRLRLQHLGIVGHLLRHLHRQHPVAQPIMQQRRQRLRHQQVHQFVRRRHGIAWLWCCSGQRSLVGLRCLVDFFVSGVKLGHGWYQDTLSIMQQSFTFMRW
jgi:hypothetical protein